MFKKSNPKASKKVYVGMSGGVDSSVSAFLLKEQGYDVTGVFIQVWQPDWIECNWKEERLDAMRVASALDIPFITLDLEKEYKKEVVDYMISEYKIGRTPNPDIMCNKYVKFGGFFDWAIENGADYVATGHYARVEKDSNSNNFNLISGDDKNKDQSYFLWTLNQKQLSKTLFPVGNIEKDEVRKIAKKAKLPNFDKKDSQGLCFIGKVDIKDFLKRFIDQKDGDVLDQNGKIIGKHKGSIFYTIGERHGFTILDKTENEKPYYIFKKDLEKNILYVSDQKEGSEEIFRKSIDLKDLNIINEHLFENGAIYKARSRYRQPLQDIKITRLDILQKTASIEFENNHDSVAPGQSLVIYRGDICLGGGIII